MREIVTEANKLHSRRPVRVWCKMTKHFGEKKKIIEMLLLLRIVDKNAAIIEKEKISHEEIAARINWYDKSGGSPNLPFYRFPRKVVIVKENVEFYHE